MKEKTLFKTLVPTIAMLVVAILALSGVTYAWFTSANAASIGQMELNVEAVEGLLISTQPTQGWKSDIAWSEITAANGATTQSDSANIKLAPVSTTGDVANGKINFFTAELANDSTKIKKLQAAGTEAQSGYLSFNLYIWNSGATEKTINLGQTTVTAKADTTDKFAENAVRIGFVTQSSKDMGTAADGFTAGTNAAVIYEPNATAHTITGTADYKALGGQKGNTEKYEYYGLKGAGATLDTEYGRFAATEGKLAAVTTYGTDHTYVTLPANKVTKVTVYVWLEGQDADCLNDISGSDLAINLKLAGPAAETN